MRGWWAWERRGERERERERKGVCGEVRCGSGSVSVAPRSGKFWEAFSGPAIGVFLFFFLFFFLVKKKLLSTDDYAFCLLLSWIGCFFGPAS